MAEAGDAALSVAEWLRALHLEQYTGLFEQHGLVWATECQGLSDTRLMDMGMLLPGHRRRVLAGLLRAHTPPAPAPRPAPRPVPMKRHVFRSPPVPATPPELMPAAGEDEGLPTAPPIPPRRSCLPPTCFTASSTAAPSTAAPSTAAPSTAAPEPVLPPLPAKRHLAEPSIPPVPPRTRPPRLLVSLPSKEKLLPPPLSSPLQPEPEELLSTLPPGPPQPPSPPPCPPEIPPKPQRLFPEFDDSDYYEAPEEGPGPPASVMTKQEEPPPSRVPRAVRVASLLSEGEELSGDDDLGDEDEDGHAYEGVPNGGWHTSSLSLPLPSLTSEPLPHPMDGLPGGSTPITPVIKAGWLDKNPPQGSYIYQKRWVRLDADYLRYFDSNKDAYSKRFISVACISRVAAIGDQKFEVITNNRTFAFRAESDAERRAWMQALQKAVAEQRARARLSSAYLLGVPGSEQPDRAGSLELRGFKNKLYVAVVGDKVQLYKNLEEYHLGIGITFVDMSVGNVKEVDRRSFDLTTPYRIFSFSADSEPEKEQWLEAMQGAIAEALSTSEVAERIWTGAPNRFCADCGAAQPDWASINLCVVICKRCAGEHRGLGAGVSKVRSLKMDKKVWTETLIELFLQLGNGAGNRFWAANVPPSEALQPSSSPGTRRRHLEAKYCEGKYRRYHPLFGNQEELDKALCAAVTTTDLAETQALLGCGAGISCFSGDPEAPTPLALAEQAGQTLQMEFLRNNRTTEVPRLDTMKPLEKHYSVVLPTVSHSGFLYKTASAGKPLHDRRAREEFSRRWCVLSDGVLSYYENERAVTPNGEIRASEIVCLAVPPPDTHGFEHTFEVYTEGERLYLFGLESAELAHEWVKCIAKAFVPPLAEDLLAQDFERLGRLPYKAGLSLQRAQEGWFSLTGSELRVVFPEGPCEEPLQLRKLQELSVQGDSENQVLVLVERRRTLYIQGERRLDFMGWLGAIQKAAASLGDTLSEQQLGDSDIPVIVYRCVDYITQCGLTSEGIYRKCGQTSKTQRLLESLRQDARSVRLKEGEQNVDDVSSALKRFLRDLPDGLFTRAQRLAWLEASEIENEEEKVSRYRELLVRLPPVNRATVKALISHLYCVQCFSDTNQMNTHNLAIVFGPTLFQTDGQDYKAGRVVEDLINHYVVVFNVDEEELRKQREEITAIVKMRVAGTASGTQHAGDFICTVYLEEKKAETEQHVKIPASMTAEELTLEILDRRNVGVREKDYWTCFEVNEREEAERPLHFAEKVLPILHGLGTDSHLVVKKHQSMEAMLLYLASRVGDTKHGMMKFREDRSLLGLGLPSGGFHDRYFILNSSCLRLYKEVRSQRPWSGAPETSHRPEKEWPVKSLKVYLGVKKKLRPPTCWGFTVVHETEKHEKQQWYLCCDTQMELREWFATFLFVQHDGLVWPSEPSRVARAVPEVRLGSVSLIPLRGSENEMRRSVAAFTTDPLSDPLVHMVPRSPLTGPGDPS
nr:arf-GAP with Rho-GAP domain, ANK repeat and PH domain-containing protein 1 isoform X1 [Microcebus murinus]XP_012600337.1 arf-GAP with Rho-GAP domain, ANK repeat and PH domain-containing protein 1 isoform X1 [Microcebus murinus]XP_012600338.1 arf-GAP with Rho-GAP domain, ANK repeat and PH domain-containing protein 1 isoform X1 [Microcebus murinus]XP_012600339.1 arf-GAP with Rho-GAP domain, ANK repeat and PH domain-containing protein 1 isoform X1 [Microcebus murinus]XP_012600340.1 arf-GAP with